MLRSWWLGNARPTSHAHVRLLVAHIRVPVSVLLTGSQSTGELAFAIAVFLSGIVVTSLLISGLNEIVTQMDVTTTLYRRKMKMITR